MTPDRPIQVINDWPGSGDRGDRKVPTTLVYNADGSLSSWGFDSWFDDITTPGKTRREFFKIFIEDETLSHAHQQGIPDIPQSVEEAQSFIVEYLKHVYAHIKESIEAAMGIQYTGGWNTRSVRFLFSVPATWKDISIINRFKDVVRQAGFGIDNPERHSAQVDLTEAEAAAVATLKAGLVEFNSGSLFLTVDAGGGTTDLALMRVTSTDASYPEMTQVSEVRGVGIGASLIDRAFIALVTRRLESYPDTRDQIPADCALQMSRSFHYRNLKHKFGEKAWMQSSYRIQIDGVSFGYNHAGLGVEGGKMIFSR